MDPPWMKPLRLMYPIELPNRKRDRPLQVLALGLSRSGTDSLRQALLQLGYHDVYHGFTYGSSPSDATQWIRLGHAQERGLKADLSAQEFDRILGNCAAITDIPAAGFAHNMLDVYLPLYPDIKVILNYRDDIDKWAKSCENTIEKVTGLETRAQWMTYIETFFNSNLFWAYRSYWWVWSRHFGGDFKKNGKGWYIDHYRNLEERLTPGTFLKWKVEDGWIPLCEFLGKPVPEQDFPDGNVPAQFFKTAASLNAASRRNAHTSMILVGSLVSIITVAAASYLLQ